jgi:hypothetical protein
MPNTLDFEARAKYRDLLSSQTSSQSSALAQRNAYSRLSLPLLTLLSVEAVF